MKRLILEKIKECVYVTVLVLVVFSFTHCDSLTNENQPCTSWSIDAIPPYSSPTWHPAGNFVTFNYIPLKYIDYPNGSECDGQQIFEIDSTGFWSANYDGRVKKRLFSHRLISPSWSPDGNWIAFIINLKVYKIRYSNGKLDSSSITQLTTEGDCWTPSWSPDGKKIAYDSNLNSPSGLSFTWIMDVDGSNQHRITYTPDQGETRMPSWSPDSKQIVHMRYLAQGGLGAPEIFLMDSSGANVQRLTNDTSNDNNPQFTPDGTSIIYLSENILWKMNLDGSSKTQLSNALIFDYSIVNSPDNVSLLYCSISPPDWSYKFGTIWILDILTKARRQLTYNP